MTTEEFKPAYFVPLSTDELATVGLFIVVWNQTESLLKITVATLLRLDAFTMEAIMGGHLLKPKIDVFLASCKLHVNDPLLIQEAEAASKKLLGLVETRNQVAHAHWTENLDLSKLEGRKTITSKPITTDDLHQKLNNLCSLSRTFADLNWRIMHHLNPAFTLPSPWAE